jgi:hypothetical protein
MHLHSGYLKWAKRVSGQQELCFLMSNLESTSIMDLTLSDAFKTIQEQAQLMQA